MASVGHDVIFLYLKLTEHNVVQEHLVLFKKSLPPPTIAFFLAAAEGGVEPLVCINGSLRTLYLDAV